MTITIYDNAVSAEVYTTRGTDQLTYLVKVSFPDLGLYISGVRVTPSTKTDEMWVQLPAYQAFSRWIKPFETSNDSTFMQLITEKALEAVNAYKSVQDMPTDAELSAMMDATLNTVDPAQNSP